MRSSTPARQSASGVRPDGALLAVYWEYWEGGRYVLEWIDRCWCWHGDRVRSQQTAEASQAQEQKNKVIKDMLRRVIYGIAKPQTEMTESELRYHSFRKNLYRCVETALFLLLGYIIGLEAGIEDYAVIAEASNKPVVFLLGLYIAFYAISWYWHFMWSIGDDDDERISQRHPASP